MPNYTNAVAATSQVHTYVASLTLSYDNIALIPGIPHKYQIEVERIFTTARAGSPTGVVAFQSDASVPVEQKRDVYIIPETLNNNTYLTFNETAKTITIAADLSTLNKVYTNPSNTIYVPNIVAGQVITFRRKTISNTPLVTWSSGTKLTSNQLNLETTQLLYLVQEVLDRVYRQISISGDIVSQIADNAITTSKIVDLNVTTGKINDLAVTTAKLADLNVTTGKINDLAVTTAKIADYNITPAKLINTSQAWSLTGTLALTDLATSATGDKVTNKNYVLDRVSKYGVITKDSTVTSNVLDTPPTIPTDANDDVSLQSGGIWFNPRDGGLRVRVLDKWVRVTGTPLNITDYISTGGTAQTKTGNLILTNGLNVTGTTTFNNSITISGNSGIAPTDNLTGLWVSGQNAGYPNGGTIVFRGNNGGAGGTAANGLEFYAGGSEKMRLDSSGNFMIGTTSPSSKLTVNTSTLDGITLLGSSNQFLKAIINTSNGSFNPLTVSGDKVILFGKTTGADADTGGLCLIPWSNSSNGVRIGSDGKVGIGVTPATRLHVHEAGVSSPAIQLTNGSTGTTANDGFQLQVGSSGDAYIWQRENQPIGFATNDTERMKIREDGRVCINTNGFITNYRLNISYLGIGSQYGIGLRSTSDSSSTSSVPIAFENSNGSIVGYIGHNQSTTVYYTSSDYRLKTNIKIIKNALSIVDKLKPINYTWVADNTETIGFIAHELQEVIPYAVSGKKDAIKEDGSIDPQQVDLSKIIPVLTAAIQELKTIVEEQAKRISVLEGK